MSTADRRIAVITALPEEARAIARALGVPAADALRADRGSLVVAWTGDGAARARRNLALLLNRIEPNLLIGAGVAGALTGDLARGTVVRPSSVSNETGSRIALSNGLADTLVVSADRPLFSSLKKQTLARALGVESRTIVDLETFDWAEVAANRKIPFSVVRIVFDDSSDDLPAFLADAVRPDGSTDRRAVLLSAILHPGRIRALLNLRLRLRASCAILGTGLASALRELA